MAIDCLERSHLLTEEEEREFEEQGYRYKIRIEVTGRFMKEQNEVIVGGRPKRLGDPSLSILLALVVELKKGAGGWIHLDHLTKEGRLPEADKRDQKINRLRDQLVLASPDITGTELIERSKNRLRLSTHPSLVTVNWKSLKTHPDGGIKRMVRRKRPLRESG